jgi:VPDSG-CTERM motif
MKPNIPLSNKLALVSVVVSVVLVAFSQNASAAPITLPPVSVPDGGVTIMLLGTALGGLVMARRFLMR